MKAIVINEYGEADQLIIQELPIPEPTKDEVLIKIKAFGINRAEIYMRRGLWGDVAKVSGIECVGEVANDPSGNLKLGQTVAAIMGGMGRTRNGSYAEYTCVSMNNIFPLQTNLDWAELAAIPESYATAWSCLYQNMSIKPGDCVFIRGGTSALGQAAINIASNIDGVTVLSSTRNANSMDYLQQLGCHAVFKEDNKLSEKVKQEFPQGVNSVMDIVGNSTLIDSMRMVSKNGFVCNAGFLGGSDPISFNPLTDMPPTVNLNFFASFMFGTEGYPVSDIPMQTIVNNVSKGVYKAKPGRVFKLKDILLAHQLMESNSAQGKIVVSVS